MNLTAAPRPITATEVSALQSRTQTYIESHNDLSGNGMKIDIFISSADIVRADIGDHVWADYRRLIATGRLSDKVAAIAILINAIEGQR